MQASSTGSEFMPTYIVSSAILRPSQDPKACATNTPRMLVQSGITDIKLRSCYCCSDYGNVVFVVDGESRDSVLQAFNRINVPIASVLQAEEIRQTSAARITA